MDACVVCGEETPTNELWCDPCWVVTKARCLEKFSKPKEREKSANAKAMVNALGLEKADD